MWISYHFIKTALSLHFLCYFFLESLPIRYWVFVVVFRYYLFERKRKNEWKWGEEQGEGHQTLCAGLDPMTLRSQEQSPNQELDTQPIKLPVRPRYWISWMDSLMFLLCMCVRRFVSLPGGFCFTSPCLVKLFISAVVVWIFQNLFLVFVPIFYNIMFLFYGYNLSNLFIVISIDLWILLYIPSFFLSSGSVFASSFWFLLLMLD